LFVAVLIAIVYGALLGFTVVVGWQQFLTAQVNVSNEASALTTLYRQTVAMPQPEQSQVREQLRKDAAGLQGPKWGKEQRARSISSSSAN
jgi:predicted negative regulator of RcsB-dependent stress response